jgi:hypothetical protein
VGETWMGWQRQIRTPLLLLPAARDCGSWNLASPVQ